MTGKEYQELAMKTNDRLSTRRLTEKIVDRYNSCYFYFGEILNGCLGLAGEVGEFNDMIKKWIFHEQDLDTIHAKKELGDVLWYIALICYAFGWDMDELMEINIEKLRARYPDGFDPDRSANRTAEDV